MARFSITAWVGFMLALQSVGCTGQNVEGRWRGRFPLEGARACEMRLNGDRTFTVDCDKDAEVGGGRYSYDGRRLTFTFSVLTYGGKVVRSKPVMEFAIEPGGNQLTAKRNGESFVWERTLSK